VRDLPIDARECGAGELMLSGSMHELCDGRLFLTMSLIGALPSTHSFRAAISIASRAWRSCARKGWTNRAPSAASRCRPGRRSSSTWVGWGIYWKIKGAIDRRRHYSLGSPAVDDTTPWAALSTELQGEMDQAVAMLREAADQGHMEAQAVCGDLYGFGFGVAKDGRLAFVYREKSAQQGDLVAQYNTGIEHRDGLGCDQSYRRAAEWLQKAALQGHAGAQHALGYAYEYGQGVPQSDEKAFELYSQSAAQGHPYGQSSLAICYHDGRGCKQSYERAVELFRQSAAQGLVVAQCNLAVSETRLM